MGVTPKAPPCGAVAPHFHRLRGKVVAVLPAPTSPGATTAKTRWR